MPGAKAWHLEQSSSAFGTCFSLLEQHGVTKDGTRPRAISDGLVSLRESMVEHRAQTCREDMSPLSIRQGGSRRRETRFFLRGILYDPLDRECLSSGFLAHRRSLTVQMSHKFSDTGAIMNNGGCP